ncbi:hypothetical protein [Geobacillus stearothermophilus]|uniref:Uncharacterized protein n=1 Tax=Geobacillus stearothermophilus TaxID=1422 RepID=A0A150MUS7_GEOSE|nr:hypothetical protein [Geobacillus stearothermophilus]KYD28184.1 hypothetical protein B4109_3085 [Geobacillus stearothermophilus]MED4358740.1 hypothetical protein [Geobacillus stearothermophilus]
MIKRDRQIFFDKQTGEVLAVVDGDIVFGEVRETTIDEAFEKYEKLKGRVRETVGYLKYSYEYLLEDFLNAASYRVNPETLELEFSYPDPNEPEPQEPVYQKPLSEQFEETKQAIAELTLLLTTTMTGGM